MNLVESVYEISEKFMTNPTEVKMNFENIEKLGNEMLKEGPMNFETISSEDKFKDVLLELVASSINYCYWYGRSDVRPNESSSVYLYECIANAFFDYTGQDINHFNMCLSRLTNLLITKRFPLIEERMYHLNQLRQAGEDFANAVIMNCEIEDVNDLMLDMIKLFPGFGSDMFLKRVFLFFMQMNRRFGWFEKSLETMPVAADYQIPKLLEHFKCFYYSSPLKSNIKFNTLIPKGSKEECEIRAATVLTCRELCKLTGWNIAQVDGYFWLQRKVVTEPFHLCITTDY